MGNKPLYLANNIFKVETGSKLTDDKDLGINGFYNNIIIVKSRSNRAGQVVECVYDQNKGFDNVLSNYAFLKAQKRVGGAGRSFYLEGAETAKFAQKEFKRKLKEKPEMQQAYKTLLAEELAQFIYVPEDEDEIDDVNENEEIVEDDYEEEEY